MIFKNGANATTMGKMTFAVRENLCHAFSIGRTTKRFFAVSFRQDARQTENAREKIVCRAFSHSARQTLEFAVRFRIAHDKLFFQTSVTSLPPRENR
jgi:hypothetical protein